MAYFRNSTINLLNLHYGIHSLALSGGGGVLRRLLAEVWRARIGRACIDRGDARLAIRPIVLVLARRLGLKPLLLAGTIASGLQYPLLAEVHGVDTALLLLCAVSSVGDTFYWTTYHAFFASLGDAEHRGHQVGAREAVAALVGIIGPLATGWALAALGPRIAFGATAVVLVLAALPIVWTPNVEVRFNVTGALKAAASGVLLFAADGWIAVGYAFVWQIALFLSLGESYVAFGGAMALSAVVGALSGMFLGQVIDAGHGVRAAWIALAALAITTVLRAVSYGNAPFAVVANACGAIVTCVYLPVFWYSRLQPGKALALHVAFSYCGGSRVGHSSATFPLSEHLVSTMPFAEAQSPVLASMAAPAAAHRSQAACRPRRRSRTSL